MRAAALALTACLVGAGHPPARDPSAVSEAVFRRKLVAPDGTALALYRYVPPGGGLGRPPVLLVPELGFGREAYDLAGSGLARYLQHKGREVYVVELRGQGRSAAPEGFRLADWVAKDLPAAAKAIRREREGPIDLVAHGYSGTLVLAACAVELAGSCGRVIALSTPVEPAVPNALTESLLSSGGQLGRWAVGPEGARSFQRLFAREARIPSGRLAELRGTGIADLGSAAAEELLGWLRSGDLALPDGSTVRGRIAKYDRPTLLFLPLGDDFAHPEYASPLRELSAAPVQVKVLSRIELLDEDYTHLSVLHGDRAAADVFEPALEFLDAPAEEARR